eukprot:8966008-Prorocentrum_lima.AAC.1
MTSSLVGSEMCIRDRVAELRSSQVSMPQMQIAHGIGVVLAFDLQCVIPVSYTHLTLPTICSV